MVSRLFAERNKKEAARLLAKWQVDRLKKQYKRVSIPEHAKHCKDSMTTTEWLQACKTAGLNTTAQVHMALGICKRTVQRYNKGERSIPTGIVMQLRYMLLAVKSKSMEYDINSANNKKEREITSELEQQALDLYNAIQAEEDVRKSPLTRPSK